MADRPDTGRLGDFGLKPPVTKPPSGVVPKPPVTQPPEPPLVAPPGGAMGPDPTLASWAHFGLEIGGWRRPVDAIYDSGTHKYKADYIHPRHYRLTLDAGIGLGLNLPKAVGVAVSPGKDPSLGPGDDVGVVGDPGGVGGGAPIPTNLVAFSWNVATPDGRFHDTKIVKRPVKPMEIAVFDLPAREDTYDVRLRVHFNDGRFAERTVRFDVQERFIVSLGDSSASGQGNPDWQSTPGLGIAGITDCDYPTIAIFLELEPDPSNDAQWVEPKAWRSMKSAPAVAARQLENVRGQTNFPSDEVNHFSFTRIAFASFARSGAEVLRGLIEPQGGADDFLGIGQVEECRRTAAGRHIDALMIDIGGNDAGFSDVLKDLVSKDTVYTGSLKGTVKALALAAIEGPPGVDKLGRDQVEKRLSALLGEGLPEGERGQLEQNYDVLYGLVEELKTNPGVGEVYITGYPIGLFDYRKPDGTVGFKSCGIFEGPDMDMTGADGRLIKRVGRLLNELIARKAGDFEWHYVDVEKEFEGHGYCSAEPFWRTASESCKTQGDFEGTMHPNADGVEAWATKFVDAMRTHGF